MVSPSKVTSTFDYDDFVDIFEQASMEQMRKGGGSVSAEHQAIALQWVDAMKLEGQDLDEVSYGIWLNDCVGDLEGDLTPLAWAVNHGLVLVVERLLSEGCDLHFSFSCFNDRHEETVLNIIDLMQGWSETSYYASDCEGIIHAFLEQQDLLDSTPAIAESPSSENQGKKGRKNL